MSPSISGPWQLEQIAHFLSDSTLPLRLSCIGSDGFPRVISLWFQYRPEGLLCVTHQSSKLVTLLERNNRVGFEIAPDSPPYRGVRGQGSVQLTPLGDRPLLRDLLANYVGDLESPFSRWLLARSAEEMVIFISPLRFYTWDYRERMSS